MDIKQQLIAGIEDARLDSVNNTRSGAIIYNQALAEAIDLINTLIPDNTVLVPMEPTEEMSIAGSSRGWVSVQFAENIYKAMLANQGAGE